MIPDKIKVLWHWLAMGPYHFARMNAVADRPEIDLTVVETTSRGYHDWADHAPSARFPLVSLSRERLSREVTTETRGALEEVLARHAPDVVIAAGYSEERSRRTALQYVRAHPGALCLFWSESTAIDQRRAWIVEKVKSLVVRQFDGALVAGSQHAKYLENLGMPADRIGVVGGCVDNQWFSERAKDLRQVPNWTLGGQSAAPYFLYVGRLIPQKNLHTLLQAFRQYRRKCSGEAWDLVLVGNGASESQLRTVVRDQDIQGVHFAGFRQMAELPDFYAHAGCFVLPSAEEPWGLVTNEAMASGLPVVVSGCCGCAPELVHEGQNGFTFDPKDTEGLAGLMERISQMPHAGRELLGSNSLRIIESFTPGLFAERSAAHIKKRWLTKLNRPLRTEHATVLPSRMIASIAGIRLGKMPR